MLLCPKKSPGQWQVWKVENLLWSWLYLFNTSFQVKCRLFLCVMLAFHDFFECENRIFPFHVGSLLSGKYFRNGKRLGKKPLYAARPPHRHLVFFGKLFHAQYGNDVLKLLVALKNLLHPTGNLIMLASHQIGIKSGGS